MKSPAFLFYSSDFMSEVAGLTMEEIGQFITMLCLQHQKGELTEKTIRLCVGSVSVDVLDKFTLNENNNYQYDRLKNDIEKYNAFTESRRRNGQKGGRPALNKVKEQKENQDITINKAHDKPYGYSMDNHMGNRNENENINEIKDENNGKRVQGENQNLGIPSPKFSDPIEANFSPELDPELLATIAKTNQCPKDQLHHRYSQYRNSCIANDTARDKKGHVAGFSKWLASWHQNEKKMQPIKNNPSKTERLEKVHSQLDDLILQYQ